MLSVIRTGLRWDGYYALLYKGLDVTAYQRAGGKMVAHNYATKAVYFHA